MCIPGKVTCHVERRSPVEELMLLKDDKSYLAIDRKDAKPSPCKRKHHKFR